MPSEAVQALANQIVKEVRDWGDEQGHISPPATEPYLGNIKITFQVDVPDGPKDITIFVFEVFVGMRILHDPFSPSEDRPGGKAMISWLSRPSGPDFMLDGNEVGALYIEIEDPSCLRAEVTNLIIHGRRLRQAMIAARQAFIENLAGSS
jgi:hypothetical protein